MARLGVPVGWAGAKVARSGDHPQRPRLLEAGRLGASSIGELTPCAERRSLSLALEPAAIHALAHLAEIVPAPLYGSKTIPQVLLKATSTSEDKGELPNPSVRDS
jgi:hypothetical protein